MNFNFIDLFAGAGGFSCGLEQAGHHCLLGVDHEPSALQTFAKNHPQAATYGGDIKLLTKAKLAALTKQKPIHLVVGGPPCQGFSTVGIGDPEDERNSLFQYFLKAIEWTRPYYVIMENVTGLLAKKNAPVLEQILRRFMGLGYEVSVKVLSSELYGVPERRRRTFFLASRLNSQIVFPKEQSVATPLGDLLTQLKATSGQVWNHEVAKAAVTKPLDLARIAHVPEGKSIRYQQDEERYLPPHLRLGVDWAQMSEQRLRQAKYQRLNRADPSPTILTNKQMYFHPTEHRYLTVREAAKIQTFPNDFIFCGSITQQWRQIGNAVPPQLAKTLGTHLKALYRKADRVAEASAAGDKRKKRPQLDKIQQHLEEVRARAFSY